jgi:hypothetical protein
MQVLIEKLSDDQWIPKDSSMMIMDVEGKSLAAELMNDIAGPLLLDESWTPVTVKYWHIDSDWITENISGEYKCFGYYWYFENPEDATVFALRWS